MFFESSYATLFPSTCRDQFSTQQSCTLKTNTINIIEITSTEELRGTRVFGDMGQQGLLTTPDGNHLENHMVLQKASFSCQISYLECK